VRRDFRETVGKTIDITPKELSSIRSMGTVTALQSSISHQDLLAFPSPRSPVRFGKANKSQLFHHPIKVICQKQLIFFNNKLFVFW
jgi:hypothetical protein